MIKTSGIAVALALLVAAPAAAAPALNGGRADQKSNDSHWALDGEVPTDRPIVATVVDINGTAGTVTLATPHGNVKLSVPRDLVGRLTVGDVVVVRFTDAEDEDFPSASPRENAPAPGLKI